VSTDLAESYYSTIEMHYLARHCQESMNNSRKQLRSTGAVTLARQYDEKTPFKTSRGHCTD